MLAIARTVAPEVARGLSTALALLSSPSCPPCQVDCSPSLHCPEVVHCPDCVCEGSLRHCATTPCHCATSLVVGGLAVGGCLLFAIGVWVGYQVRGSAAVVGKPVARTSDSVGVVELSAAGKALARRQLSNQ